jgi:hypothetical protein
VRFRVCSISSSIGIWLITGDRVEILGGCSPHLCWLRTDGLAPWASIGSSGGSHLYKVLSIVAQALLLLYIACVQVRMFLLLPATSMRAVSGRYIPMRVGLPTGTRMHRSFKEAHNLLGQRVCAWRERNRFHKTLFYLLKCSFGFIFYKLNTWHLNCNNYFTT